MYFIEINVAHRNSQLGDVRSKRSCVCARYVSSTRAEMEHGTYLQQMRSLPAWYCPFGPQRRGSSMTATPRLPLSARKEPSVEAASVSTANTCGAVGISVCVGIERIVMS